MKKITISKNHLLHDIDKCSSINELYRLVQKYKIDVRMQTLDSASNISPKKPQTPFPDKPAPMHLERLKRAVMQAVEEQYKNAE